MNRDRVLTMTILMVGLCAVTWAQQGGQKVPPPLEGQMYGAPPSSPMTAPDSDEMTEEERKSLAGMPGANKPTWSEFLESWMTPRPVAKSSIVRIDDKYAFPHVAVSIKMEIVREDEETVWLRGIPPEDPSSALHRMWQERQAREIFYKAQRAWEAEHGEEDFFVDFQAELMPPPFMDSMSFEEIKSAMPDRGRWQMNFALDDMNGDGIKDLVFPPTRKGTPVPAILLGLGDGRFKFWEETTWPKDLPFDYGGVGIGDFDGDGHRDIAIGIHFKGQYAIYGDGKGNFTRSRLLPSPDARITSRAVAVADFDGDGLDDAAFLAEIDYDLATNSQLRKSPTVWVVLSKGDRWMVQSTYIAGKVIGDNLKAADVNADGRIDLVSASNTANHRRLVYLNQGDGNWENADYVGILSNAYHPDVEVLVGESATDTVVYTTFVQFLMVGDTNNARTGLVMYGPETFDGGKHGVPLFFDDQRYDSVYRLGAGDLNGDGLTDVVATRRKSGRIEVFVQNESGEFYQEQSPELLGDRGMPYSVMVEDLDGDGMAEIIVMSADKEANPGGVRIFRAKN